MTLAHLVELFGIAREEGIKPALEYDFRLFRMKFDPRYRKRVLSTPYRATTSRYTFVRGSDGIVRGQRVTIKNY